jgi:hypothetical protein
VLKGCSVIASVFYNATLYSAMQDLLLFSWRVTPESKQYLKPDVNCSFKHSCYLQ